MSTIVTTIIALTFSVSTAQASAAMQINQLPGEILEVSYYYADGNKLQTGLMEDGVKTGEWITYDHDGTITARAYYDHGQKTGKWRIYDAEGQLTYKICYRNDKKMWAEAYDAAGEMTSFAYVAQ